LPLTTSVGASGATVSDGAVTVMVTSSATDARPRLSVTMSEKVSVASASPAASVGAVKVGMAAVASDRAIPAGAVHA